jgi:hypothetical protein
MTRVRLSMTPEAAHKLIEKIKIDPQGFEEFMKQGGFAIKASDVALISNYKDPKGSPYKESIKKDPPPHLK